MKAVADMAPTPLQLAKGVGLRLADPERPELGWRTFAFDRIRQTQRKKEMNPKPPRERPVLIESTIRLYGVLSRLESEIKLDAAVRELVKIRASQINGCAFCIDMHWKDARAAGESEERLYSLAAWHESPLYSKRERAALALCEAITLIADNHVADDVWDDAAEWFVADELAHLVFAISTINTWNRLAITARTEPGDYQPPTLEEAV